MTMVKPSEPWSMTADQAARRKGHAAESELALRNAMEAVMRERRPKARIVHEIVMGEGRVRADMAAIDEDHIAAFEIKGQADDTTRLLHQVAMYQLAVPEVWMVVHKKHDSDARLIHHLLPSVGIALSDAEVRSAKPVTLEIAHEPVPRLPEPRFALEMLWSAELHGVCQRQNIQVSAKAVRRAMIDRILELVAWKWIQREICTALRARDAQWRADAPIRPGPTQPNQQSSLLR